MRIRILLLIAILAFSGCFSERTRDYRFRGGEASRQSWLHATGGGYDGMLPE